MPHPLLSVLNELLYKISDIDDLSDFKYYGFVNREGGWYITREDLTAHTYRYATGETDYPTNWENRKTTIVYGYFYDVF